MWKIIDFVSAIQLSCTLELCEAIDRTTPIKWHTLRSPKSKFVFDCLAIKSNIRDWSQCSDFGNFAFVLDFSFLSFVPILALINDFVSDRKLTRASALCVILNWKKWATIWITDAKRRPRRTPGRRHQFTRRDGKFALKHSRDLVSVKNSFIWCCGGAHGLSLLQVIIEFAFAEDPVHALGAYALVSEAHFTE